MRKSFALLLTLSYIALLSAIAYSVLNLINNSFNTVKLYQKIAQNSTIIYDTKKLLDHFLKDVNDSEDFENLLIALPVSSKDGNFLLNVSIVSPNSKINLNEFLIPSVKPYLREYFENLCEHYEVYASDFLEALILDTIDNDDEERIPLSEIALRDSDFRNGKIYSFSHFKQILDYYFAVYNDPNVYKIPWEDSIYFGEKKVEVVDCDRLSKKNATFLNLLYNEEINCEELNSFEENSIIMQKLKINSFSKNLDFKITVNVDYALRDLKENFIIEYDIKRKKIISIKKKG